MDMSKQTWAQVDAYLQDHLASEPEFIKAAHKAARAAKLPEIEVSPLQGKFLAQLIEISGAKRVLELGTLGGYSTLWMAHALPEGGHIITLDHNPVCAGVARANFTHAKLDHKITLKYGEAMDSLKALIGEMRGKRESENGITGPFDLVFIDANKPDYPEYLHWVLKLTQKGSIIIADNIVREGTIIDENADYNAKGVRKFIQDVAENKNLQATALQTVGNKGYDGFMVIRRI